MRGEDAFVDEVFDGGVPPFRGENEAFGFAVGDEAGGGGGVEGVSVGAEGDDGADVVAEKEIGGEFFAVDFIVYFMVVAHNIDFYERKRENIQIKKRAIWRTTIRSGNINEAIPRMPAKPNNADEWENHQISSIVSQAIGIIAVPNSTFRENTL